MLRSIISCLIYIHVVVFLQSTIGTTACDIEVSNSQHHAARHGIYKRMSSAYDCDDRPTYRKIGSYYFYYSDSTGAWIIGPTRCSTLASIHAVSNAATPDKVTETWQEYDGDTWVDSASLQVGCYVPPVIDGAWGSWGAWSSCSVSCDGGARSRSRACDSPAPQNGGQDCVGSATETGACNTQTCPTCDQIEVRNSRHNANRHGTYDKMSSFYSCNGRPTYEHYGSTGYNYMYYIISAGYGVWMVGPKRCEDFGAIHAVSTAMSPDRVTETWQESDGNTWVNSPYLQVGCYIPPKSSDGVVFRAWLAPVAVVVTMIPTALGIW